LFRKVVFNYFAVYWNGLLLALLYTEACFFSPKLLALTQSVGNYLMGTSETTREASHSFISFQLFYTRLGYHNPKLTVDWLRWFIGFTEGDGSLITSMGRVTFVLTQKEEAILVHIQSMLGFGYVRRDVDKDGSVCYRYIVDDLRGVLLLALLFNGNLVLLHRVHQLREWLAVINRSLANPLSRHFGLMTPIVLIDALFLPGLHDAWLSGFTDAEGCFNISIRKDSRYSSGFRVTMRFILDQKNALGLMAHIKSLFGSGSITVRFIGMFRYTCESMQGLAGVNLYFQSYPLKTKKASSLANWLKAYTMLVNQEHLTSEGLDMVRAIKATVNPK